MQGKTSHKIVITVLFYSHTVQEQAALILFLRMHTQVGENVGKGKEYYRDQGKAMCLFIGLNIFILKCNMQKIV